MNKSQIEKIPTWLNAESTAAQEIILSSSIKLKRNIKDIPLPHNASREQLAAIKEQLEPILSFLQEEKYTYWDLGALTDQEVYLLMEKHLLPNVESDCFSNAELFVSKNLDTTVTLNCTEHLLLQNFAVGLQPGKLYDKLSALDDLFEKQVEYAFSGRYGYITGKLADAGTGLVVSILLHLPGLVGLEKIESISAGLEKMNMKLSRMYSDDARLAIGNLYLLKNIPTVAGSEQEILDKVATMAKELEKRELQARRVLMGRYRNSTENYIWRAVGLLKYSRAIQAPELLSLISYVGLGIDLKLISELKWINIKRIITMVRNAHIKALYPKENPDKVRADLVRAIFSEIA